MRHVIVNLTNTKRRNRRVICKKKSNVNSLLSIVSVFLLVQQNSHLSNFPVFHLVQFPLSSSNYSHFILLSILILIPTSYFHFPYTFFLFPCSMFPFPISKFLTLTLTLLVPCSRSQFPNS